MKKNVLLTTALFVFLLLLLPIHAFSKDKPAYLNPDLPVDQRVDDLLVRMTLEEKIAQLRCCDQGVEAEDKKAIIEKGIGQLSPILRSYLPKEGAEKANRIQKYLKENTRLGIPVIFHDEGLHGLLANGATSFPQAIGLAATWNTELMEKVATTIALETKSRGIRQLLSPVINIARDTRWGRVEETYGEDPYLTSRMGVAFCKGLEDNGVISTPKHYAANVGDGGRDSNIVHFSERLLREIYFPAFKACFQEGGAKSVMSAYNSLEGIPCTGNKWLLTDVLRNEWGFEGFVVSDYGSTGGIMYAHHTASTKEETAKQALEAGLDIELPNIDIYGDPLLFTAQKGIVSEEVVNRAVRRVLKMKFLLGLFDNPYVDPENAAKVADVKEHRELALQAEHEAIVLLKNEKNTLPLDRNKIKSVAVIGPAADLTKLGGYSGWGTKVVTVLEGIKNKVLPDIQVNYAKGCDVRGSLPPIRGEYLIPAGGKEGEHGLKAEYFNNPYLTGDPDLVRTDSQVDFDWGQGSPDEKISVDKYSVRWTGKLVPPVSRNYRITVTSDDGVRLYIDGKLLIEKWFDRGASTDEVSIWLEAGQKYDIKVEFYENGGFAVARLGWDSAIEADSAIKKAVETAKKSDIALVAVTIIEGEGQDRSNLDLPSPQEDLIKAIAATDVPTIVILVNGSAVTMKNWVNIVDAILETWYSGEEGGNAIADVLFGDYNPAGRLPITFPQTVGQVPLYYNPKPTGRGYDYVDGSGKPQFPFGYGLSYTEFKYSNLKVEPEKVKAGKEIEVSIDIKNMGERQGDEVVQLYIHRPVAIVSRPLKELTGFIRISLKPNEKKTVKFKIKPEQLSYLDRNMKMITEPGDWEIMVGSSSDNIRSTATLTVEK